MLFLTVLQTCHLSLLPQGWDSFVLTTQIHLQESFLCSCGNIYYSFVSGFGRCFAKYCFASEMPLSLTSIIICSGDNIDFAPSLPWKSKRHQMPWNAIKCHSGSQAGQNQLCFSVRFSNKWFFVTVQSRPLSSLTRRHAGKELNWLITRSWPRWCFIYSSLFLEAASLTTTHQGSLSTYRHRRSKPNFSLAQHY